VSISHSCLSYQTIIAMKFALEQAQFWPRTASESNIWSVLATGQFGASLGRSVGFFPGFSVTRMSSVGKAMASLVCVSLGEQGPIPSLSHRRIRQYALCHRSPSPL
jgi:hypothetical protein